MKTGEQSEEQVNIQRFFSLLNPSSLVCCSYNNLHWLWHGWGPLLRLVTQFIYNRHCLDWRREEAGGK